MTDDDPVFVDCDKHGKGLAAVVCRHLCDDDDRVTGFIENSAVPGDRQAWCQKCEDYFLQQGEMTEEFKKFNDMALVCETCYEDIKRKHSS